MRLPNQSHTGSISLLVSLEVRKIGAARCYELRNRDTRMHLTNESTLRARARKLGYAIHKSRLRSISEDNFGKYALVKEDSKRVVLGERFDASLEEIAEYLS
jgi:hypothetical protein